MANIMFGRNEASRFLLISLLVCQITFAVCEEYPTNEADCWRFIRDQFRKSGFQWMSPTQYHSMDKKNNTKPYMFTFLSSRCPHCRRLVEHFAEKEDRTWLASISAQFNSVMIWDNFGYEYVGAKYNPTDMNYVPRTIFAYPNGTMRWDTQSKNAGPENQFFYLPRQLLFQMWEILQEDNNKTPYYHSDLNIDMPS